MLLNIVFGLVAIAGVALVMGVLGIILIVLVSMTQKYVPNDVGGSDEIARDITAWMNSIWNAVATLSSMLVQLGATVASNVNSNWNKILGIGLLWIVLGVASHFQPQAEALIVMSYDCGISPIVNDIFYPLANVIFRPLYSSVIPIYNATIEFVIAVLTQLSVHALTCGLSVVEELVLQLANALVQFTQILSAWLLVNPLLTPPEFAPAFSNLFQLWNTALGIGRCTCYSLSVPLQVVLTIPVEPLGDAAGHFVAGLHGFVGVPTRTIMFYANETFDVRPLIERFEQAAIRLADAVDDWYVALIDTGECVYDALAAGEWVPLSTGEEGWCERAESGEFLPEVGLCGLFGSEGTMLATCDPPRPREMERSYEVAQWGEERVTRDAESPCTDTECRIYACQNCISTDGTVVSCTAANSLDYCIKCYPPYYLSNGYCYHTYEWPMQYSDSHPTSPCVAFDPSTGFCTACNTNPLFGSALKLRESDHLCVWDTEDAELCSYTGEQYVLDYNRLVCYMIEDTEFGPILSIAGDCISRSSCFLTFAGYDCDTVNTNCDGCIADYYYVPGFVTKKYADFPLLPYAINDTTCNWCSIPNIDQLADFTCTCPTGYTDGPNACNTCDTGYEACYDNIIDPQTLRCEPVFDCSGQFEACSYCVTCFGIPTCAQCDPGYIPMTNGSCVLRDAFCELSDLSGCDPDQCDTSIVDSATHGTCKQCPDTHVKCAQTGLCAQLDNCVGQCSETTGICDPCDPEQCLACPSSTMLCSNWTNFSVDPDGGCRCVPISKCISPCEILPPPIVGPPTLSLVSGVPKFVGTVVRVPVYFIGITLTLLINRAANLGRRNVTNELFDLYEETLLEEMGDRIYILTFNISTSEELSQTVKYLWRTGMAFAGSMFDLARFLMNGAVGIEGFNGSSAPLSYAYRVAGGSYSQPLTETESIRGLQKWWRAGEMFWITTELEQMGLHLGNWARNLYVPVGDGLQASSVAVARIAELIAQIVTNLSIMFSTNYYIEELSIMPAVYAVKETITNFTMAFTTEAGIDQFGVSLWCETSSGGARDYMCNFGRMLNHGADLFVSVIELLDDIMRMILGSATGNISDGLPPFADILEFSIQPSLDGMVEDLVGMAYGITTPGIVDTMSRAARNFYTTVPNYDCGHQTLSGVFRVSGARVFQVTYGWVFEFLISIFRGDYADGSAYDSIETFLNTILMVLVGAIRDVLVSGGNIFNCMGGYPSTIPCEFSDIERTTNVVCTVAGKTYGYMFCAPGCIFKATGESLFNAIETGGPMVIRFLVYWLQFIISFLTAQVLSAVQAVLRLVGLFFDIFVSVLEYLGNWLLAQIFSHSFIEFMNTGLETFCTGAQNIINLIIETINGVSDVFAIETIPTKNFHCPSDLIPSATVTAACLIAGTCSWGNKREVVFVKERWVDEYDVVWLASNIGMTGDDDILGTVRNITSVLEMKMLWYGPTSCDAIMHDAGGRDWLINMTGVEQYETLTCMAQKAAMLFLKREFSDAFREVPDDLFHNTLRQYWICWDAYKAALGSYRAFVKGDAFGSRDFYVELGSTYPSLYAWFYSTFSDATDRTRDVPVTTLSDVWVHSLSTIYTSVDWRGSVPQSMEPEVHIHEKIQTMSTPIEKPTSPIFETLNTRCPASQALLGTLCCRVVTDVVCTAESIVTKVGLYFDGTFRDIMDEFTTTATPRENNFARMYTSRVSIDPNAGELFDYAVASGFSVEQSMRLAGVIPYEESVQWEFPVFSVTPNWGLFAKIPYVSDYAEPLHTWAMNTNIDRTEPVGFTYWVRSFFVDRNDYDCEKNRNMTLSKGIQIVFWIALAGLLLNLLGMDPISGVMLFWTTLGVGLFLLPYIVYTKAPISHTFPVCYGNDIMRTWEEWFPHHLSLPTVLGWTDGRSHSGARSTVIGQCFQPVVLDCSEDYFPEITYILAYGIHKWWPELLDISLFSIVWDLQDVRDRTELWDTVYDADRVSRCAWWKVGDIIGVGGAAWMGSLIVVAIVVFIIALTLMEIPWFFNGMKLFYRSVTLILMGGTAVRTEAMEEDEKIAEEHLPPGLRRRKRNTLH